MKKITFLILALICFCDVFGQKKLPPMPPASSAPLINVGVPNSFSLKNGLNVILIENNTLPTVTFYLEIDNAHIVEKDKKGVADLCAKMLFLGSKNRTKEQFNEMVSNMGAVADVRSNSIYFSGLSKYTDNYLELLSDLVNNPLFSLSEFRKIKEQTLKEYEQENQSPETILTKVYRHLTFTERNPLGEYITHSTIKNIELEDCLDYYSKYWTANNATLLVMGDISLDKLKPLVEKYFKNWQKRELKKETIIIPEDLPLSKVDFIHNPDSNAEAKIIISNLADLNFLSKDVYAAIFLNTIMGGDLLEGASKNFINSRIQNSRDRFSLIPDPVIGYMYLRTQASPDKISFVLKDKISSIENLRRKPISEEKLDSVKKLIIGKFALSMESKSSLGAYAIGASRGVVSHDFLQTLLLEIDKVTVKDIQLAAQKYFKPSQLRIVIYGDARRYAQQIELMDLDIDYWDKNANKIPKPSLAIAIENNITAEQVIQKYLEVIAGEKKLSSISTLRQVFEVEKNDKKLRSELFYKLPFSGVEYLKYEDKIYYKKTYNGNMGYVKVGNTRQDMSLEDVERKRKSRAFFPLLDYQKLNFIAELDSIVPVRGKFTYKLYVQTPDEEKYNYYFCTETFLPLKIDVLKEREKIVTEEKGVRTFVPDQIISSSMYYDYRNVFGIKYPHSIHLLENNEGYKTESIWNMTEVEANIRLLSKDFR